MTPNDAMLVHPYRDVSGTFARCICLLGLVACALESPSAQGNDDWPRWRGAAFDDTAHAKGVFDESCELKVRWKSKLGSGYSGVVLASRRAVTMFSDGTIDYVVALNADDGEEAWRLPIAPTWPGRCRHRFPSRGMNGAR